LPGAAELTGHDSLAPRATKHGINPVENEKNALPAVVEEKCVSKHPDQFHTWEPVRHQVAHGPAYGTGTWRNDGWMHRCQRQQCIHSQQVTSQHRRPRSCKFKLQHCLFNVTRKPGLVGNRRSLLYPSRVQSRCGSTTQQPAVDAVPLHFRRAIFRG
jgi:hypothetical protein